MKSVRKFYELTPYKVREVLFVSSEYDAFVLETEGQMAERLFYRYSEFNMSGAPRISHASTVEKALEVLASHRVDLVVNALRNDEGSSRELLSRVHKAYPHVPVVLLMLDVSRMHRASLDRLPSWLAGVYIWTGDLSLITAMFSQIEDRFNVDSDTSGTGVQVIIAVEDTVADYSVLLPLLYDELMKQSNSLAGEGVNSTQRTLRMLARPKILLASNYEKAVELFDKYRRYVLALVSDVRFRQDGRQVADAGFRLAEYCCKQKPNLAVFLQSSELKNSERAQASGWQFAYKNPETLRPALHNFLEESLGFGDFVFRMPDRTEVARAKDTYDLEHILHTVDLRSLYYHASNNNFNVWLRARNYFDLADDVERVKASDYSNHEDLRQCLIKILQDYAQEERHGVVADFSIKKGRLSSHNFFRLGSGSIGGKGRGIAFINSLLAQDNFIEARPGLKVAIPKTLVLSVDIYDQFMKLNGFDREEQKKYSDERLLEDYLKAKMPESVLAELRAAAASLKGPLAVRSSSLLEDSQNQSCAGIYATCMIPNNHPDPEERCRLMCQAIKRVYMSAISVKARTYLANSQYLGAEEKMAVLLQEVVGFKHGRYFYPNFAGVAMSSNYYPIGPQRIDDGVVAVALGLGATVAGGGRCMRFSPKWPRILPHQYYQAKYLDYAQREFYAIDLNGSDPGTLDGLVKLDLAQAEKDGTLAPIASVFCADSGVWRDSLSYPGPRAVTFSSILQWNEMPLAQTLGELLERFKLAIGCPVEMEFAVDLAGSDASRAATKAEFLSSVQSDPNNVEEAPREPILYILQLRPLTGLALGGDVRSCGYPLENIFCTCDSLGHGVIDNIADIVYVTGTNLGSKESRAAAMRVAELNDRLLKEQRPYALIGPGRWGSLDPNLGIPVQIGQILGARLIVELPYGERFVEPSMGSHFFHELASMRIGYMNVCLQGRDRALNQETRLGNCREEVGINCFERISKDYIDTDWLNNQPIVSETEGVRHLRLTSPLHVRLNGRCCRGVILKSQAVPLD